MKRVVRIEQKGFQVTVSTLRQSERGSGARRCCPSTNHFPTPSTPPSLYYFNMVRPLRLSSSSISSDLLLVTFSPLVDPPRHAGILLQRLVRPVPPTVSPIMPLTPPRFQ
jgi:hypothetical protein